MKKLPPYGKPLADLIDSGHRPNNSINVFIGKNAWNKARAFSISYPTRTLCLPPLENPFQYKWPVEQCDILIIDTGYGHDDYANDVAYCLYEEGALIVRSISPDFKVNTFIR